MSRRRRRPGEVWLETRPESPFYYVCWYDRAARRVRWESTGTAHPAEAEKARARRVLGIAERPAPPAADPAPATVLVLDTVLDDYLTYASTLPSGEQNTIAVRHLKRILGADLPITALAAADKQQAYVEQRWGVEGRSPNTVARELTVLRAAVYRAFAQHDHLKRFRIGYFSQDDLPVCDRHLTHEEAAKLIAHAGTRHVGLFMRFALSTAGRPEAVLDARWSQIRFKDDLIELKGENQPQTDKRRPTVKMTPELKAALLEAKEKAKTDYVIEYGGFPIGRVVKAIRRAGERAGLGRVTPIILRHTAAVWMAKAGVPLHQIALILGHKDDRMVQRHYARYHPDYMSHGARVLSASMQAVEARALEAAAEKREKKRLSPQIHPTRAKAKKTAPALVVEKAGKSGREVVGATGIEPVTPTMSR